MFYGETQNFTRLKKAVISNSEASTWEASVMELELINYEEAGEVRPSCVCGKSGLHYLFTIQNKNNGNILRPIGSTCIQKFGRDDMYSQAIMHEQMFKLLNAVKNSRWLELDNNVFSRAIIDNLYKVGAFDTEYNGYDGECDYIFILKMFNKRDKGSITAKQHSKITAITINSIMPYLAKYYSAGVNKIEYEKLPL